MMKTRLQIVMLAPFGIRPKGTLLVRMLPLAQALTRRGHHVSLLAPPVQNPQDAGRSEALDGVLVTHTTTPTLPGPASTVQQALALLQPALAQRPDIIHLFKPKGYGGLAALLARALRPELPLVIDTDDWEGWGGWNDMLPYPRSAKTLFAWQERDLPRRANAVTVASRTLETQVWGFGVPQERVQYVPNGIAHIKTPIHHPPLDPARPVLLLYTRFWEFDVRDIVAALAAIIQRYPAARLLVVGRGERGEERELLRLAARAGVGHVIDNRGWVEPAEIPGLLASATLALAPMDDTLINRARCSVKHLELMAAGLPIVAGRVGQAAEYIEDGRSGLLVRPGDAGALAGGVLALLDNEPWRTRLGQAAHRRATSVFHWDALVGRVEQAYRIALGERSGS